MASVKEKINDEEKAREKLEELFKNAKTPEDWNNIRFAIDDYLDMGYNVGDYILRYNSVA